MTQGASNNKQVLEQLNIDIGNYENDANREKLEGIIHPNLAFRRASGTVVDKATFLKDLKAGGRRRETSIMDVDVKQHTAVVTCVVQLREEDQSIVGRFLNTRLFIKEDNTWKLLGWANEPVP